MRRGEAGQAALLLGAAVLALAAATGLAAHRVLARELAVEGEVLRGTRASLAADSVLAWFLARGYGVLDGDPPEGAVQAPADLFEPGDGAREEGSVAFLRLGPLPGGRGALWKLTVRARHEVTAGGRPGPAYEQAREAYAARDGAGPPELRAWRILR